MTQEVYSEHEEKDDVVPGNSGWYYVICDWFCIDKVRETIKKTSNARG